MEKESILKSETKQGGFILTKEIKLHGISFRNELGDWYHAEPKDIRFFNNGKEMKCFGYVFNVKDDINTLYIVTKEEL